MTDRTVVYRLQADVQQFRAQMATAGASVKKAADDMTAGTKEGDKFRRGLDSLGGTAGKVGLVAAAGLGAAVLKAANFDQAMSNVQAATHESASAMESLRAAALEAGADTAFSATEAAAGIENLAKAGVSTAEILDGGLTGALDLAAAGGMEVADAAEAAAGAMAQFGLDGDQVPHIADLMAAAAGKAQGEVSDFTMALKQGGTVASQTGLTLEETTGALAAMAEQSLLGSDAGTSFKTMLGSLTPNSKKAADAMAAYNINAFDAQGNFVGMTELAGQLQAGLGDLTDEQRAMALETIFGSDAVRAASIIYDNGAEGIADWTAKVNDAGFAAETAAIKQDNLRGDLEKLGGALETALIGTGDGSQGMLRGLTQGLTGAVDAYTKLPEGAQNAAGALLAASAAVGGTIWVGSKLVQGISNTREALDNLGISGGKAGSALKGLATAGTVATGIYALSGAVVALANSMDETLPGMETLEGRLINLANTPEGFSVSLGAEFDSLGESVDRLSDPSKWDRLNEMAGSFNDAILPGDARDKGIRQATAEVEALDDALASMASSGNADLAADALARMVDAYGLSESQTDALMDLLPDYNEALAGQANDAKLAAAAQADLAGATGKVGGKVKMTAAELQAQAEAMEDARKAARETADSFNLLGEGLDDAELSLGDWIKQMADAAAAVENFQKNAKAAAKNGLDDGFIASLEDAGEAGALRMKQLANATDEEIARVNKAWRRGQRAKEDYVNYKVPPEKLDVDSTALRQKVDDAKDRLEKLGAMKPSPKVDADTAAAETKLNNLLAKLREAERDRSSTVTTTYVTKHSSPGGKKAVEEADGGVLDFYANGGMRENHTAQIAPAGAWRVWAEPETGGEAYIPLAPSKRERSIDIWEEVGARLGVQFQRFASGGTTDKDKKKPKRKFNGEQTESEFNNQLSEQAAAQAAEAAEMFYAEQERALRESERRAEEQERLAQEAADRQKEYDDAVLAGHERAWEQATREGQERVDLAQRELDAVESSMERIGDAATAAFNSPLFSHNQQRGLWAGGAGTGSSGWRDAIASDISGLSERSGLIAQLSGQGLNGAALEALLGQSDNAGISAMLAKGEIADYAALFAQRAALQESVGQQAGFAGYGAEHSAASAVMAQATSQLAALTAAIESARPITVLESVSAQATAAELVRLLAMAGAS